jgi:hypothetical protein
VINLEEVHWTDVDVNEEGNATGVLGSEFKELLSKKLRTICSRLNLKGVKNVKKQSMVDRLNQAYKNWINYKTLQNRKQDTAPRKQVQCSFRLLNILFSDEFATPFASLGDAATRQALDIGTAANDEAFWVEVQQAFVTHHENYDVLLFNDAILADNDINPGDLFHHNWKKLRSIWKVVKAKYKATLTRYTISGTHESDFYDLCNGKLDVNYLRKHLEQQVHQKQNDIYYHKLPEHLCHRLDNVPRNMTLHCQFHPERESGSGEESYQHNQRSHQ